MNISVTGRSAQSKGVRKKRLRQGFVPGAVYGRGVEPFLVEVRARAVVDVLLAESGMNTVIDLTVEGDSAKHTVMIDTMDRDPITRNFRHVGFHQVMKGDKVTARVPIQLIGTPPDVAFNDALLEQTMELIEVHAQPADLPVHLEVDVSHLKVGESMRVADLPHNPKIEFMAPEDAAIATLHYSKTAQAVEEAETPAGELDQGTAGTEGGQTEAA